VVERHRLHQGLGVLRLRGETIDAPLQQLVEEDVEVVFQVRSVRGATRVASPASTLTTYYPPGCPASQAEWL
jgi:hypothetical protein